MSGIHPSLLPSLVLLVMAIQQLPVARDTSKRDPQAIDIVARALNTMGSASTPAHDALLTGNYTSYEDESTGTITIKYRGQTEVRQEIRTAGSNWTIAVREGKGWAEHDGERRDLPLWVTKYLRPMLLPTLSRIRDFAESKSNLTYIGLEDLNGTSVHHIRISSLPTDDTPAKIEDLMSEFHVFIDSQSFIVVKTLSFDFSPKIVENRVAIETYYDDYKPVSGQLIPFHIQRFTAATKTSEITITSARINVGLTDSEFQ